MPLWGVRDSSPEVQRNSPNALYIILACFHIYVDIPEIQSFVVRLNDPFKDCSAPFWVSHTELKLREFRYGFEV